ncbi:MAG TPA: hypothetical protein VK821_01555 [Dehalococcoidia bacterium]|nr:hypothetical protein [Dehalococcoidia bacterium]
MVRLLIASAMTILAVALFGRDVLPYRPYSVARAATASSFYILYASDDAFYNYDFESQYANASNVDWAISLLFWNNANKAVVQRFFPPYTSTQDNNPEQALNNDGYNADPPDPFMWDTSVGVKNDVNCFTETDSHFRPYGNGVEPDYYESLYNPYWGYFVLGSDHLDNQECWPPSTWFGWSEDAEQNVVNAAINAVGSQNVAYDWSYFYNYEPYRAEGNHIWYNDGNASAIRIP